MSTNNTNTKEQVERLIDLLVSGAELPEDFLESLQAWLIDGDKEEIKNAVLKASFDQKILSSGSHKYALEMWPELAKRLGMDPVLAEKALSQSIEMNGSDSSPERPLNMQNKRRPLRRLVSGVAAAAAVALIAGTFFFVRQYRESSHAIAQHTLSTVGADTTTVVLPDGSKVKMNKNTTLSYAGNFTEQRAIKIDGEAFFMVARDERHPFTVESGDVRVTVLGTEFYMRAFEADDLAEVVLATGKVKVSSGGNSVTLSPLEKATIYKTTNLITTAEVGKGELLRKRGNNLVLDGVSLDEAFRMVGEFFNVEVTVSPGIRMVDGVVVNLDYDASVSDALYFLQAINPVFDYEVDGNRVTITKR